MPRNSKCFTGHRDAMAWVLTISSNPGFRRQRCTLPQQAGQDVVNFRTCRGWVHKNKSHGFTLPPEVNTQDVINFSTSKVGFTIEARVT
eukprot:231821-Karenia_brevis.AAC.1